MIRPRLAIAATGVLVGIAACAGPPTGDPSPAAVGEHTTESPREWTGTTREVPGTYPTIQSAVDAADSGDMVLVDSGVYREAVTVTTPGITLRGVDRNEVIIDGEFSRDNGVAVLFADGVSVENLTSRNNRINGFFWTGVRGFRGSYLTAINNGDYGIYAFDSSDGLFEYSYASGSPDAAYYIGQCNPCESVITDSVGEWSGLGYSGTNASTEIFIVNNVFRFNGAGVAPNSLDSELLPPTENVVVSANLIHDNGYRDFPHKTAQWATQGNGVVLAGVRNSSVTRNRIVNHPQSGVAVIPNVDDNVYMSSGNVVAGNVIAGSGLGDLTLTGPSGSDNCFEENQFDHTMPPALQLKQPCDGPRLPALFEMGSFSGFFGRFLEAELGLDSDVFYGDMPHPPDQTPMPEGADAPVFPAVDVFAAAKPDVDLLAAPVPVSGLEDNQQKGFNLMGVSFASTIGGLLGLYAYILPLVLYAAWVVIAVWEIIKRDDMTRGAGIGWMLAILVVPFLGVIAYYILGGSRIPAPYRWVLLAGGLGVYALFLLAGLFAAGVV